MDDTAPPTWREDIQVHPFNSCFRMMSADELEGLAESITALGLLNPIILDKAGVLLDGKCRLRACEIAGVEPRFETFEGDEEECEQLIISLHLHRSSLSPSQKAVGDALLAYPGCYWEHRVLPEARIVAQHQHLADAVLAGTMTLSEAYQRTLEYQKQAELVAVQSRRLADLREEQPYLAMQVDEGGLTLDQAIVAAAEQAAAPTLSEHAEAIRFLGRRVITDIIEIGRRLAECKALLGHGNWLPWLDREFGWGRESTALNFMRVYQMFGANPQHVADLDLPTNVFYLLAAPSTPAVVREEILARAQHERVSHVEVRRLIDATRPDRPTRDPHQELRNIIDKMARELPDDPLVDEVRRILLAAQVTAE